MPRKGVVRLLAVSERSRQLFGKDGSEAVAELLENNPRRVTRQLTLFADQDDQPVARAKAKRRRTGMDLSEDAPAAQPEATTLDRVHVAMLLHAGGRTNALRALLKAEQERGPHFLRLANALSALYPRGSEEKRLLDPVWAKGNWNVPAFSRLYQITHLSRSQYRIFSRSLRRLQNTSR